MKLGHFAVVKVGGDTTLDLVDASIDFNGQHDGFLVTKEQFYEILISRPGSRPTLPVRADARRSEFDRSLRQLKGGYFDDCTATSSKSSRTRTAAAAQKPLPLDQQQQGWTMSSRANEKMLRHTTSRNHCFWN